ncbi:MAG: 4-hydroxythreonine-4-phosphate dehydrogenase PdxA [Gammaproteobacteria bacterium]|nr:MAG: 4-hydroxythreonine-4-phosphate dehydrogenase PdxA [Gammaproteobacteria bacterium]
MGFVVVSVTRRELRRNSSTVIPRKAVKPFVITTGEPAGVGPDLVIQLSDYLLAQPVVLCGDIGLLRQRAQHLAKIVGKVVVFHHAHSASSVANSLPVEHISLASSPVTPGKLDKRNSNYVVDMLATATDKTLSGHYSAIVTAPIHKGIICQAGGKYKNFTGHTEFLAERTHSEQPVMVLSSDTLKVGLITTHLPLSSVAPAITRQRLIRVLTIIHHDMKRYFMHGKAPRIGVCGLNPHAGEDGHMGNEEINVINPTLSELRQQGLDVSDALPADTLFVPKHARHYDIIVAMYHDQGLPVIKSQGFGSCVNLTFGLPIIRTSVDHGTALDLAGTGKANPNSLKCAIDMAKTMAGIH